MPPTNPCEKLSKEACNSEGRSLICQWAGGAKRSYCRKIPSRPSKTSPSPLPSKKSPKAAKKVDSSKLAFLHKKCASPNAAKLPVPSKKSPKAAKKVDSSKLAFLHKKCVSPNAAKLPVPSKKSPKAAKKVDPSKLAFLQKLNSSPEKRQTPLQAALTTTSKHYVQVADAREQPSIRAYRAKCKHFPHPVELFSSRGIVIPLNYNYAQLFRGNITLSDGKKYTFSTILINSLERKTHSTRGLNTHLLADRYATYFLYENYKRGDVIIGVKHLIDPEANKGHMVFYEVRMRDVPDITVVDPNGRLGGGFAPHLTTFFGTHTYRTVVTNNVNSGDRMYAPVLKALGMHENAGTLGGYCATIALFFLIDYVCTDRWNAPDNESHFARVSREWIYAPEENKTGLYSVSAMWLRTVLFGRYLAYRMVQNIYRENPSIPLEKLVPDIASPLTATVRMAVTLEGETSIRVSVWAGDKKVFTSTTEKVLPIPVEEESGVAKALIF